MFVFFSDDGPALEMSDFAFHMYTNFLYFDKEKLYGQYAFLKSRIASLVFGLEYPK